MNAKDKFRKLKRKMSKIETRHMLDISDLKIELGQAKYERDLAEAKLGFLEQRLISKVEEHINSKNEERSLIEVVVDKYKKAVGMLSN